MNAQNKINGFPSYLYKQFLEFRREVPPIENAHRFLENMVNFLFPIKADKECVPAQIELNMLQLQIDFKDLLRRQEKYLKKPIDELSETFFSSIPDVYDALIADAKSFIEFDPAARSIEGVIIYYPGFYSITVYRLAHELYKLDIPFLPRIMTEYAHSKTGIDIHPGATIGENFFIDHGTGVVIGETTIIGDNVKIYQGVTLGAICVQKDMANVKRHPTIEDNVIIYSGTSILGGDTVVGHNSVIGGNVWLTKSVDPYSVVYHESKTIVRDKNYKQPIDFVI
jgi:serine O-acetyltransferase